ncbi:hypothetical protein ACW9HJ_31400 [Nocardia gipuzkoensis]
MRPETRRPAFAAPPTGRGRVQVDVTTYPHVSAPTVEIQIR